MSINYVDPSTGSLTPIAGTPAKVVNSISNPNLLDNPWFTVNQRGQSSYTALSTINTYTVDRWRLEVAGDSHHSVTVNNDGSLTVTNNHLTDLLYFSQSALKKEFLVDEGTEYVASVDVINYSGTIYVDVGLMDMSPWSRFANGTITSTGINIFKGAVPSNWGGTVSTFRPVCFILPTGASMTIRKVKFERGAVSTLANDAAPNYQQELAKCQRYYYEINNNDGTIWMPLGLIHFRSNTQADWMIRLPVEMCTAPAVTFSDIAGATINYPISGGTDISISSITLNTANTKAVGLLINTSAVASLNTCGDFWLQPTVSTKITFSADL